MSDITIRDGDTPEEKIDKIIRILQRHDENFGQITDNVYDFTSNQNIIPQTVVSIESDQTTTDLATHVAASDPHTGYRLESADHTHQTTGAQAGQLDHGLAMTAASLAHDDHTIYLKADGTRNLAAASGMKIGTATSDQLGFYNKTPVDQPAAVSDATDAATAITHLNLLLARIRETGIIAT